MKYKNIINFFRGVTIQQRDIFVSVFWFKQHEAKPNSPKDRGYPGSCCQNKSPQSTLNEELTATT